MQRSLNYVFHVVPTFDKDRMNMSFHGNQIGDIVAILLLKHSTCINIPNETKWIVFGEF